MSVVSYPGVYIEEFEPGAPIAGVGTSTAAFIGAATIGPVRVPTKVTSWDAFKQTFGDTPVATVGAQAFYLWYAAQGFFANGGTVCYVLRVATGAYPSVTLDDANGTPALRVQALDIGTDANNMPVDVMNPDAIFTGADVVSPPTVTFAAASGPVIQVSGPTDKGNALDYQPGDEIELNGNTSGGGTASETATVARVAGSGDRVELSAPLSNAYTSGSFSPASLAGQSGFRVMLPSSVSAADAALLGPGTVLSFDDNVTHEVVVVTTKTRMPDNSVRFDLESPVMHDHTTTVSSVEFSLKVTDNDGNGHKYTHLSMNPANAGFVLTVVARDPSPIVAVSLADPPTTSAPPQDQPKNGSYTLTGGAADNPAALSPQDYSTALDTLVPINDINIVAIPDRQDSTVQLALVNHCEQLKNRFAVLDSNRGVGLFGPGSVEEQRNSVTSDKGYAALYYPWLLVPPAAGTQNVLVPPSGHVAGIYARTDAARGVEKAPAGLDCAVAGALAVNQPMGDTDQGQLNLAGIDVIRVFVPGGQPVVWGARTTASDANWQYVNIRRLFIYLEQSILEGIRWAVFEPNNLSLWQQLKRTITDFLTRVWRDGGLFGAKAEEAFYVRIDDALNPFSEQQLGRLNIEIGCRPAYPAEFIIVRIGIWDGGSQVTEG